MSLTEHDSTELTRSECLSVLRTVPVGRLVFTEGALPAVLPVTFVLDPAGIAVRAPTDSALARSVDGSVVALQADEVDPTTGTGWSVTVVGQARTARDRVELERLATLPLVPWPAGDRSTVVIVEVGIVSGRRIGGPAVVPR